MVGHLVEGQGDSHVFVGISCAKNHCVDTNGEDTRERVHLLFCQTNTRASLCKYSVELRCHKTSKLCHKQVQVCKPTLPVRMALMRFCSSHMLDPDCPLLDRQVWPMMLAHACTCNALPLNTLQCLLLAMQITDDRTPRSGGLDHAHAL